MLSIERVRVVRRELARLPVLARVGLGVIVSGGLLDVAVHLGPVQDHVHPGAHVEEHMAHLIGVVGMALTWAGVVVDGVRRQLRHGTAEEGSTFDANR